MSWQSVPPRSRGRPLCWYLPAPALHPMPSWPAGAGGAGEMGKVVSSQGREAPDDQVDYRTPFADHVRNGMAKVLWGIKAGDLADACQVAIWFCDIKPQILGEMIACRGANIWERLQEGDTLFHNALPDGLEA